MRTSTRVAAGVPTGGQFATSARPEAVVSLAPPPAQHDQWTLDDVKVAPDGAVKTRAGGETIGRVTGAVGLDGRKAWTPRAPRPLHYPVPGVDGATTERRYKSRTQAVQALLNHHNGTDRAEHWADAPAYDWADQEVSQWGHRTTVAQALRGRPLLHGSPHPLADGDILLPDQVPANFKQSDPFAVSLTTEVSTARYWARTAAQSSGRPAMYVYEVEPLTDVELWNHHLDGLHSDPSRGPVGTPVSPNGAVLRLEEGRVGAARIVRRIEWDQ